MMTDEELAEALNEMMRIDKAYTPQVELRDRINGRLKGIPVGEPINWSGIK